MGAFPQKSVTPYNAVSYSCIFLTKHINKFYEYQIIFKKTTKNPPKKQNPTNQSQLTNFRLTSFLLIQNRKCQSLLFFKEWVIYFFLLGWDLYMPNFSLEHSFSDHVLYFWVELSCFSMSARITPLGLCSTSSLLFERLGVSPETVWGRRLRIVQAT